MQIVEWICKSILDCVKKAQKLTECVDLDTSMNTRYGGICEIKAKRESQKFRISDILIEISITKKIKMTCMK